MPLAVVLLSMVAFAAPAHALLQIDITRGNADPMPIAVPDLVAENASDQSLAANITQIIAADLERSGLFSPIDPRAYIEKVRFGEFIPRFADWRQIDAQALVSGNFTRTSDGRIKVAFRLWDVLAQQQVAGKEFATVDSNWRRVAHLVADEIYKRLTGEEGYFDSRIVYVSESGPAKRRIKRLAIMDQDGANHKFLTDGKYLVLTPRFSPSFQEVIYLSYAGRTPQVHIRDLETGRDDVLGSFDGMSFSPRFSPKGDKVVMSIAKSGNSEIYVMDLASRKQTRITQHPAIDTSPSYSPDGSQIVFNSDRGGSQQLYVMSASGGNVRRISFGDGRYSTPVWSPRGDLIAFTKMHQGVFYIGVMRPDGSGERLLTSDFMVEGPTWSPNGRVIAFMRQERSRGSNAGRASVYTIDLTGANERLAVTPVDASDPAWSPLLSNR